MKPKKKKYKIKDLRKNLNKRWPYENEEYQDLVDYLGKTHFKPYCYSDRTLCKGYWKKNSNKKVRYFKGDISNGNDYRKISEYRWNVY